ncbi:MAG: hypothetical protein A2099_05600 [Planctomycetes bacterium GWF2_39_10]|nr:MAG: hypothetical protein A2Y09_06635 [Planctomycetes bacterium GWA2_39_15]OHB47407.1 MAG: hypothetical protein A2099_05600 [Planctomycetes bacterium GWF2_39_10]
MLNCYKKAKILLVHESMDVCNLKKIAIKHNTADWIYLGRSYKTLLSLKDALTSFNHVSISKDIHESAWELRRPFVGWSASFSRIYQNDISWWASFMWERNTQINPLFLYLCYLNVVSKIIDEHKENIMVICESIPLIQTMRDELTKRGRNIETTGNVWIKVVSEIVKEIFLLAGRWVLGIWYLSKSWLAAKYTLKFDKHNFYKNCNLPRIIIRTCVDEACFGKDGVFNDRYFANLPNWLKEKGFDIWTLARLYNMNRGLISAYKWLRQNSKPFIIPEDHVGFRDYIWAIYQVLKGLNKIKGTQVVNGWDITRLVKMCRWRQAGNVFSVNFLLYYRMIKNWKEKNVRVHSFIDFFENYSNEKPQILAFRKFMPEVMTIGYQHAGGQPFNLRYSGTPEESKMGPYPDRIITNGPWMCKKLEQEGMVVEKLIAGPVLKYMHLFQQFSIKRNNERPRVVLIALTMDADASVELLSKCIESLTQIIVPIVVKPHPMYNINFIMRALKRESLPEGWEWITGDFGEWLHRCKCVVTSDGSPAVEAVCRGVPTVIVGKETTLQQNILEWFKNYPDFKPVFSTDEITKAVQRAISLGEEEIRSLIARGKKKTEELFYPATEETLKAFLT